MPKTHHVGVAATTVITIALALLSTAQKDLPIVNDWLIVTAIPNAMTILGIIQEVMQSRGQNLTVQNLTTLYQDIQQIETSFASLKKKLGTAQ